MNLREAAEQALEALEEQWEEHEAIDALRQALAEEAMAHVWEQKKKEWVGLTDEEILDCWKQAYEPGHREHMNAMNMARTVEAKLKEKNT